MYSVEPSTRLWAQASGGSVSWLICLYSSWYCSVVMSFFGRVHSALAWFTRSHSSVSTISPPLPSSPSFHSTLRIRIGREIWSEYLLMMDLSFHVDRYSL